MKACICDQCQKLVRADSQTESTDLIHIFRNGMSHSDKLASWDLCSECLSKLLAFIEGIKA